MDNTYFNPGGVIWAPPPQESARPTAGRGIAEMEIERIAQAASQLYDALVKVDFQDGTAADLTATAMPAIIQAVLAR